MKHISDGAAKASAAKSRGSTLLEVARLAGVSPASVSRAFNSPQMLSPATLRRIQAASASLNYQPDGLARSLRRNRSMVIGAVMPSLRHAYFATTVEGVQSAIARRGYTLLLATSNFDEQIEFEAVQSMIRHGVDGFVLVGLQHDPRLLELLDQRGKPYVITWSFDRKLPSVGFDHRRAMASLVMHLLDLGHRDVVAVLAFLKVSDRERDRLAGVADAFEARGLHFASDHVVYAGGSGLQDGRNALRAARERFPAATAIVCANDLLAAGALMECAAQGVSVPHDLSITGYGDLDIALAVNPPLTTVRTQAHDMGRIAAEGLLARVAGEEALEHVELPTELILRGTTGPRGGAHRDH